MKWILFYVLNSAWQIPALTLCTWCLSRIVGKSRPLLEHRLWVTCLLLCVFWPMLSVPRSFVSLVNYSSRAHSTISPLQPVANPGALGITVRESADLTRASGPGDALVGLYLLSVAFGAIRLALSLARTRRIVKASAPIDLPSGLQRQLVQAAHILRVREVATFSNTALASPAVVGWPTTRLLLPASYAWSSGENAIAVFAHELAHLKRRDFALNLAYEMLAILAFYHPVLHWVRRRVSSTREAVCDELATLTSSRFAYARSLYNLAEASRRTGHGIGLSLGFSQVTMLEDRIMRIITAPTPISVSRARRIVQTATVVTGLCAASALTAMFAVHPAFAQTVEQSAPSVSAPDSPNPLFARSAGYLHLSRNTQLPYAIVIEDAGVMHGSGDAGARFNKVQQKMHGDFIWFARDRKSYVIEDKELVKQAQEYLWPERSGGGKQSASVTHSEVNATSDARMRALIESALEHGKARLVE